MYQPGTYYQGWFMYMKYTQGQNEEYYYPGVYIYVLNQVLILSGFVCIIHEVYTGTD